MSEKQLPIEETKNMAEQKKEKIFGYPPMQIERRKDGKLYLPDGTEVMPSIPVGSEEHHLRLFIEYERTFGRGEAKYQTHFGREEKDLVKEYHAFAERYGQIATHGDAAEVEKFIHDLEVYRKRYPELYKDAERYDSEVERKPQKVRIISSRPNKNS